jgi:hypothetical protein
VKEHIDSKDEEVRSLRSKLADQKRTREALEVLKHHVEKLEERCQVRARRRGCDHESSELLVGCGYPIA